MMTRTNLLHARTCALPAIAAALALSSTTVIAQEMQPAPSGPAPTTATQPTADEPAATLDAGTASSATTDTSAQTTTKKARTIKRTARIAAAKPAPVTAKAKAMSTLSARTAAPASAAAPPKPAAVPASPQSAVAPVVNYKPKPAPPQTHVASAMPLKLNGETLPIAGGALALLVVGGAAAAVGSRRRKRREQEWADAQTLAFEPFEETAAPSEPVTHEPQQETSVPAAPAFAWGPRSSAPAPAGDMSKSDDRRPGETWVERAYRGPTPNNPSVSLRNRLKRAAFFDKREREAAAGLAAPVNANAGLPGAMAGERELA
jgi:hypothetical protein